MSIIFAQNQPSNYQVDLAERVGSSFLEPFINAFGKVYVIHGNLNNYVVKTVSKIQKITSTIFYILLSPLTIPLTLIGFLCLKVSKSYKDKIQKVFRNIYPNSNQFFNSVKNNKTKSIPTSQTIPQLFTQPEILSPLGTNSDKNTKKNSSNIPVKQASNSTDLNRSISIPINQPILQTNLLPLPKPRLFKWPENLNLLGIDTKGVDLLEEFLKVVTPVMNQSQLPSMEWIKTATTNEVSLFNKVWQLPIKVYIVGKEGERRLILNIKTKKVPSALIAQGGSRKVKRCYDPLNGEFIVKKRVINEPELQWIQIFANRLGIIKNIAVEGVFKENKLEKRLSFEPEYDGSLKNLLNSKRFLSAKNKLQIIKHFLTGINDIHETSSAYTFPPNINWVQNGKTFTKVNFDTFHNDLKPDNILFKSNQDNTYEIGLSDFDVVNFIPELAGTPRYRAPELVALWKDGRARLDNASHANFWNRTNTPNSITERTFHKEKLEDRIAFNLVNGQSRDRWAIGLILSEILLKDFKGYSKSNMEWRNTIEFFGRGNQDFPDHWITMTRQGVIDSEIKAIKNTIHKSYSADAPILIPLWDIVEGMLKINSLNRLSTKQALEKVNNIE